MRTLITWQKSTLSLTIKWFDKHIYMKTQCLLTKQDAALFEKGKALVAWNGKGPLRFEDEENYTQLF